MNRRRLPWKSLAVILALSIGLVVAGFFAPGSIEGFWHSRILDCACNSRNLVEFRDGVAYISSDHADGRGELGRYFKEDGVWIWETVHSDSVSRIELYPTWFTLRIVDREHGYDFVGPRIIWPPSLKRARANSSRAPYGTVVTGSEGSPRPGQQE